MSVAVVAADTAPLPGGGPALFAKPVAVEFAASQSDGGDGGADSDQRRCCSATCCVAYSLCSCLGLITGFHWVYLWVHWGRKTRPAMQALGHAVFYWLLQIVFWSFRQTMLPWYVDCEGGETMSVPCLFNEQTTAYMIHYVIHIVLLCLQLFHWIADFVLLCSVVRTRAINKCLYPSINLITVVFCVAYCAANWDNCFCAHLRNATNATGL